MKWLVLQWLLFLCFLIVPVGGSWKGKTFFDLDIPEYLISGPILEPCRKRPTQDQCKPNCMKHEHCAGEHHCCHSYCGSVCMPRKEFEKDK
ncbi:PREDICTED: WAP four-disulfide core domain protein 10A-like [Dipodomys ordii]|uniref:WAP four-disulfide core domain protein 10A-like n=1 Tax=Dipodomys ordii TaxID=10020 RepID=A0A1S3EPB9_DIPOR|nr:PREDICTED: WAP four-disulfide core domain protein 10A-like [Dipodomys ordii]